MEAALIQGVRRRAKDICEYSRIAQAFYPTVPFQVDHVIARQHGGDTVLTNLALACLHCNSHKGPNIAGLDPKTRRLTRLFHPRRHKWDRHLRWNGAVLVGRTSIGRVTIAVAGLERPGSSSRASGAYRRAPFPAGINWMVSLTPPAPGTPAAFPRPRTRADRTVPVPCSSAPRPPGSSLLRETSA